MPTIKIEIHNDTLEWLRLLSDKTTTPEGVAAALLTGLRARQLELYQKAKDERS